MQMVSVRVWISSSIPQKGTISSLFLDTLSQQTVTVACHESAEIDLHAYTKKGPQLKPKTGALRPFVPLQGSWAGHVYWCINEVCINFLSAINTAPNQLANISCNMM